MIKGEVVKEMKKYKLGMYLGRFQPFHNGHKSIVDKMLEECEGVVIVVGSAQEKGTVKNPFPAWERAAMIEDVFRGYAQPVSIICMPDRLTVGNDSGWGDYVMRYVHSYGYDPDVIFQGYEAERNTWFSNCNIAIKNLSRVDIPISATIIRAAIIEKREDFIDANCPPEVAEHIKKSIYWGRKFHE